MSGGLPLQPGFFAFICLQFGILAPLNASRGPSGIRGADAKEQSLKEHKKLPKEAGKTRTPRSRQRKPLEACRQQAESGVGSEENTRSFRQEGWEQVSKACTRVSGPPPGPRNPPPHRRINYR